jgi:hypothetical protein
MLRLSKDSYASAKRPPNSQGNPIKVPLIAISVSCYLGEKVAVLDYCPEQCPITDY